MDEQTLSRARAEVIEKFINLEWLVIAIIAQHYFGRVYLPFVLEVLYDPSFSFYLKRRVLEKIIPDLDKKKIGNLRRLSTIRNYFAHTAEQLFKGPPPPREGQIAIAPDPRNLDKAIDYAQLYKEFQTMEPAVAEYLFKVYQELGGEYVKG